MASNLQEGAAGDHEAGKKTLILLCETLKEDCLHRCPDLANLCTEP